MDLLCDKLCNLLFDLLFVLQPVVDLLKLSFDLSYNMLYNNLYDKSTTNRSNGVRHLRLEHSDNIDSAAAPNVPSCPVSTIQLQFPHRFYRCKIQLFGKITLENSVPLQPYERKKLS